MEQGGNGNPAGQQDGGPFDEMNGQVDVPELGQDHHQGQVDDEEEDDVEADHLDWLWWNLDEYSDPPHIDDETRERLFDQLLDYIEGHTDQLPYYWHEMIRQEICSESDLGAVMERARASSRTSVSLDPNYVWDQAAATRTMQLARCFPDLERLALKDSSIVGRHLFTARNAESINWLLEAYVALQKAPGSLSSNLSSFEFLCACSVSVPLLNEFLELTASSLGYMQFGHPLVGLERLDNDLAKALSAAFGRLPHLQKLKLRLPISANVPAVVHGLEATAKLEDLDIGMYCRIDHTTPPLAFIQEVMASTVKSLASLVARSKTLRALHFANEAPQYIGCRFDASSILLNAAKSTSLETLRMVGMSARCTKSTERGKGPRSDNTMNSVIFERCRLGVGTLELLSQFKSIESFNIVGCVGLPNSRKWRKLLSNVQSLTVESFYADNELKVPAVFRDSTLNGIAKVSHSFEHLELDLGHCNADHHDRLFPSLQTLVIKAPVTLHLSLASNASDAFLFAGIEGTKTLKSFCLQHAMEAPVLAKLFTSIQMNSSLDCFSCDILVSDGGTLRSFAAACDALLNLLRYNNRLTQLGLFISFLGNNNLERSGLLRAVVNGLSFNRTIENLLLPGGVASFSESPTRVAMAEVLKENTVLKRISDFDCASNDREEIGYALWMNRSGRHFVKNPHLVTPSLLPHVLSAISKDTGADGVRYFLTHLPPDRLARLLSPRGIRRSRPSSFDD